MWVTGFSFIRNAQKYDYPVVEAIRSILPLCDDFVVAVGPSDEGDHTLEMVKAIDPEKIRIIETQWDESLRTGGRVLADETNKAFQAIGEKADWCFYIQGDEVVHERYHDTIRAEMQRYKDRKDIDGLLFKYLHFYGSYDYVGESTRWYRREIRIVRNDKSIYSYRDAQGFRKGDNKKLRVKLIDAYVYHYGWVRDPRAMTGKQQMFAEIYKAAEKRNMDTASAEAFDYSGIDALYRFPDTHPAVMLERIAATNWTFDHDISRKRLRFKERFKMTVEKWTGWRPFEYKNYKLIKG